MLCVTALWWPCTAHTHTHIVACRQVEFHNGRAAHTSDDGGAALLRAARVDVPVRQHPAAAAAAHGARPPHLPPGRRGGPVS